MIRLCKGSLVSSNRKGRFLGAIRGFHHLLHVADPGWLMILLVDFIRIFLMYNFLPLILNFKCGIGLDW